MTDQSTKAECPIASTVAQKITQRSEVGLKKYGTTCGRNDLSLTDWLNHLQQELMDAAVYVEKLMQTLEQSQTLTPKEKNES